MSSTNSGAVFFLGSRAHYQVLQQPESRSYDAENGNASTETIYQNPSVQDMWSEENSNCYDNEINMTEEKEKVNFCNGIKKRTKRRQSETTLCERDNDMKPALLNHIDSLTPKPKSRRRISVLSFLSSLARRRRRLDTEQTQYLQHLENALTACTYRESCRCLDCQVKSSSGSKCAQKITPASIPWPAAVRTSTTATPGFRQRSRYFECDESEGYSSDESDYSSQYVPRQPEPVSVQQYDEEEDDEVFIDKVPDDSTSTDMLLETKEPPSPLPSSSSLAEEDADMQLEVAAGTPVLLNYLLTHPVTCVVQ